MRLVLILGSGLGVLGLWWRMSRSASCSRGFWRVVPAAAAVHVFADAARSGAAFGLPRLPHGVAQQAMAVGDREILRLFGTLAEVGVYSIGASFGLALKLS